MKPTVLVTRRLPAAVLSRLDQACEVDLYTGSTAISREELLRRVAGKHALVCLLTDTVDAAVLDAAGPQLQIVANVAVGYNNFDLAAISQAGVIATNTPGVLDKNGQLLTGLTAKKIDALFADGTIHGGMLPKIASVLDAAKNGVNTCHIIDGRVEHALLLEVLTAEGVGTLIKSR